jgi:8-oxo-dGTP diphosphatase
MNESAKIEPPVPANTRPTVGVGIVILRRVNGGDEVVLIKRAKPPVGHWSIPGGHQELGETTREAAIREVFEETGLTVANPRLIDVVDVVRRGPDQAVTSHFTLVDFRADWVTGEPKAGDDAADARWVALTDLAQYRLWDETQRIISAALAM